MQPHLVVFHAILPAAIIFLVGTAHARVYSPRVLSPHVADTYSLKTFARRGNRGFATPPAPATPEQKWF